MRCAVRGALVIVAGGREMTNIVHGRSVRWEDEEEPGPKVKGRI